MQWISIGSSFRGTMYSGVQMELHQADVILFLMLNSIYLLDNRALQSYTAFRIPTFGNVTQGLPVIFCFKMLRFGDFPEVFWQFWM